MRRKAPLFETLPEGESFTYGHRNNPVHERCNSTSRETILFCISHKEFFDYNPADHFNVNAKHVVVLYCIYHKRMETHPNVGDLLK